MSAYSRNLLSAMRLRRSLHPFYGQPLAFAVAEGGIVTGPTQALIGEAGPEAVIPLSQGGFGDIVAELRHLRQDNQQQREELRQMRALLAKEGFTFNFFGENKEALAQYTLNEVRKRRDYGDFAVYFKGQHGKIVMGG
jgi:hypothetical protein